MSNLGGGLFGAMAAGGGTTQTAVNRSAGARSQMAELATAAVALAAMVVLAPLIAPLPQAALAAVVVAYSVPLISPGRRQGRTGVERIFAEATHDPASKPWRERADHVLLDRFGSIG